MKNRFAFLLLSSFRRAAVCSVLLLVGTGVAGAAEVRGRLDRVNPNGAHSPAVGITVTVLNPATGRSAPAITGADGMYHVQNVRAGGCQLEVWTSQDPRVPPTVYPIQVGEPYSDIPPIAVP